MNKNLGKHESSNTTKQNNNRNKGYTLEQYKVDIGNNDSAANNRKAPKKKHKVWKALLIIFIIMIILVVGIVGTAYSYIKGKLDKMDIETIDTEEIGINTDTAEELKTYRNIAILGIDSREDNYDLGNRSDCIIIVSINEKTNDVNLISVYRDTYVDVLENGTERLDKITHAYSYGGAQNALKSINEALDLNITEYATANFDAVEDIVDAVGGVTITVTSEEVQYVTGITKAGTYNLNGEQALAYSRIRYATGGDYKRTERMRTVLTKVFEKIKGKSVSEINKLADEILPKLSTNITSNELISLIPYLAKYNISDSIGWPYTTKGITLDRWYGVPCTLESNVVKLHQEVFGQADYVASDTVKTMSNAIVNKTGYTESNSSDSE